MVEPGAHTWAPELAPPRAKEENMRPLTAIALAAAATVLGASRGYWTRPPLAQATSSGKLGSAPLPGARGVSSSLPAGQSTVYVWNPVTQGLVYALRRHLR